ncbi:MAG: hydrogenase formation protein HypD [Clostridia bacterium]|nr:hydrogenase formation protein HypD [Clostridia bacterium]
MMNSTIKIMEVCGTHTSTIVRGGIRNTLPENVRLVSGPGCPVCVTGEGYIDRLIELGKEGKTIITFGDMIKVPGENGALADFKASGGKVSMVYSPFDIVKLAKEFPNEEFVFAAVGFETIAPIYAMLVKRLRDEGIKNAKLLCAIKKISPALKILAKDVDGFIAPGHVAAIMGECEFKTLAHKLNRPFCIAGFTPKAVKAAILSLVSQIEKNEKNTTNLYSSVVSYSGNEKAKGLMSEVFEEKSAAWRGIGEIDGSGLYLKGEFADFDAGSEGVKEKERKTACRCGDVLCGRLLPVECPLFGKVCTPMSPKGPCMVSSEGACGIWYQCGGK